MATWKCEKCDVTIDEIEKCAASNCPKKAVLKEPPPRQKIFYVGDRVYSPYFMAQGTSAIVRASFLNSFGKQYYVVELEQQCNIGSINNLKIFNIEDLILLKRCDRY